MAYNGSIDLINGLRPKNNGTFPLVAAKDVYVDDATRLDAKLLQLSDLKSAFDNALTETAVPYDGVTPSYYGIHSSGTWTVDLNHKQTSYTMSLAGVKKVTVTGNSTNGSIVAFLNTYNPVASQSVDFAPEFTSRITVSAGETKEFIVTPGMNYFFALLTTTAPVDKTPVVYLGHTATDTTLTESHVPADAKATGDIIWGSKSHSDTPHVLTYYPVGSASSYDAKSMPIDTWVYASYGKLKSTFNDMTGIDVSGMGFDDDNTYLRIEKHAITNTGNAYYLDIYTSSPYNHLTILYNTSGYRWMNTDKTLSKEHQPADAKATGQALDAKADKRLNVASLSSDYGTFQNTTLENVTYTWNADKTVCTVDSGGVACSGISFNRILPKSNSIAAGITGGNTYYVTVNSSDSDNLYAQVFYYINNEIVGDDPHNYKHDGSLTLPSNVDTIQLRIFATAGVVYDHETISVDLLNRDPNVGTVINNTYSSTNYNTFSPTNISQTVMLNASPTITADTNNYLAPIGDTTDRTAEILAMLTSKGICRLGPGNYYVKGLVMPTNSSIIGSGAATNVYMISSAGADNSGFAIKMTDYCTLRDFDLLGSESNINLTTPEYSSSSTYAVGAFVTHEGNFYECSTAITTAEDWNSNHWTQVVAADLQGDRFGVLWLNNATNTEDDQTRSTPTRGIIDGLRIRGFSGAGIRCYGTGTGITNSLEVTNVNIWNCWAGVDIAYFSEFHKFTNVQATSCFIGCVNNGGNNVFVNCDFSLNLEIAMLFDNTNDQSPNNTHGSAIGCVFNHTGHNGVKNTGTGVRMINCHAGFMFIGCQIFFSKVILEDSNGVVFNGCNFGKNNCFIRVTNGGAVLFTNNMHSGEPSGTSAQNPWIGITNNTNTHFVNCYIKSTGTEVKP